jgi:Peptidase family M13
MPFTDNSPKMPVIRAIVFALLCFFAPAAESQNTAIDAPKQDVHGIVVSNMDSSVKPGEDFNEYANGAWIKRTEIPPDRGRVGAFNSLDDLSKKQTAGLIEEAAKSNGPAGSSVRKIAALYNSYMDEAAIEAKGVAPLRPHLDAIAAIRDKRELARALGESLRSDVDALNNTNFHTDNLFGLWVAPGFSDSEHYTAYLLQGGLELPDREYYLGDNDRMHDIRTKYRAHISNILKLVGFTDTDARAGRIFELEHAIAEKHISLADSEDVHKANNLWKQTDFIAKAPGLDWAEYFRGAGLAKQQNFIVWQPTAFTGESALVASTSLETWKDWLAFHLIERTPLRSPKHSVTSVLHSSARSSPALRNSVRDGSEALTWSTICSVTPSAKSMRSVTSRRKRKPSYKRWLRISFPLSESVLTRFPGWIQKPRAKPRPSSPLCMSGLVTRKPGTITPDSKSTPTTSSVTSGGAACSNITAMSRVSAFPWIARNGP